MKYALKDLKRAAGLQVKGEENRVAVLGNCATQLFSSALQGCARLAGLNVSVYDADYDQINVQLLDQESEVYRYQPHEILIWLATDRLYEEFLDMLPAERKGYADMVVKRLQFYWELISKNCSARILQMNFTEIDDKALGQFSCKTAETFAYQIRKLNFLLQEAMAGNGNVYPIDLLSVQLWIGQERFYHAPFYYSAKMTVSMEGLPYVAEAAAGVIGAMQGHLKKCIIMDLDNTLWGGVIGDDGLGGIEIGEYGRGPAFTNLQRWLKQLRECGIILAVCSKNEEKTAKEPFERHTDMALRLSDISVFVADWNDKASNIRLIQETLDIGMDSIVFLDDSPFERDLVRSAIPELEVPELPEDPALYLGFLQECGYFETVSYTGNGTDRAGLYQAEFMRRQSQASYASIDDYLEGLGMAGRAGAFEPDSYARIAQLTQRSNQFNLRTVRYTQEEIARIAESGRFLTLAYTLRDRFGDYGLVGVVILEKRSRMDVFVDTWLMSCRVLKRGMEEFIANSMVRTARAQGFQNIYAEYRPTVKNAAVRDIYDRMGFTETQKYQYCLRIKDYREKKNHIREVRENGEDRDI